MCSPAISQHLAPLGFRRSPRCSSSSSASSRISPVHSPSLIRSLANADVRVSWLRCRLRPDRFLPIAAMDEDWTDASWYGEMEDDIAGGYLISSSDGEDNETDLFVNPNAEVDLTTSADHRLESPDGAITVAAHRFATIHIGQRKNRKLQGVIITLGLITFLASSFLFIDYCAWRIIKLPLQPYHLAHPFAISAVLSACAGWLYAPVADSLKIVHKKRGPSTGSAKKTTPTMGGLFFIPIGIIVARRTGLCSAEVNGAAIVTLAFAAIGLIHDIFVCFRGYGHGLPGWLKLLLQLLIAVQVVVLSLTIFAFVDFQRKSLVPLPPPTGLVYMGKLYRILTASCFATMGSGINLTDGLDGLAGGIAALAFMGISVAALPISQDLSVFGASMAGACIGFLFHNRYKASIYMGNIGSLALGGALAAIAASSGMFYPLFISSGIFLLDILSVLVQVLFVLATKPIHRTSRYISRLAPLHYYLRLYGLKEPHIVACAYILSSILSLCAGFIGLVSA